MQFPSARRATERARSHAFFINAVPGWQRPAWQRGYNTASRLASAAGRPRHHAEYLWSAGDVRGPSAVVRIENMPWL
jgi:hypothetical protein